jgi:hypothetical protein
MSTSTSACGRTTAPPRVHSHRDDVDIARRINALPAGRASLVLARGAGVWVFAPDADRKRDAPVPMPAQTVMFLTDTRTLAKQRARHITYVFAGDAEHMAVPADTEIFILR